MPQTEFTAGKTTCPYCGVGCGVKVSLADGKPVVAGDEDHPANYGKLCLKGQSLAETLSLDDRLLYPIVDGVQTKWSQALDTVAYKFSRTIEEYGPESVAFYVSGQLLTEDYYVVNKFVKGFLGTGNIDTNSRLCMASSVAGHKRAFGTDTVPGCYEDLELTDLVILVGSNLAWCHPVLFQRIDAAREANPQLKIINLDPRRTATADMANVHLQLNPDSDTALYGGLLKYLAESNQGDPKYLDSCTGLDESLNAVSDLGIAEVSRLTGLDKAEIENFYKEFAATNKVVSVYSQGVNQSAGGTDKVNAITNCHLYTGRIGKPGCGPFSITGQPNAMGGREVGGLANMLACHMELAEPDHRSIVQSFWDSPAIANKPGLTAVDLFDAVHAGKIRALWVMATNPLVSMPDADFVKDALKRCDFVVQSEVVNNNDTGEFAHVQLPAHAWGEKDGTVTNSERCISRQKKFRKAPGETRADWWAVAEVAKRLGYTESFAYNTPADIFAEYAELSGKENHGSRDFDISAYADIDNQTYEDLSPFYWPARKSEAVPVKPVRMFADGKFFTDDTHGRFIPSTAITSCVKTSSTELYFNTGRSRDQWHTMTRTGSSATLANHTAEPYIEIHAIDAEAHKLQSADIVSVSNRNGDFDARVVVTDRVAAGSVFSPMHWCAPFASAGRINTVTNRVTDPISRQPALKHSKVAIKKREFCCYGFIVSKEDVAVEHLDYFARARCEGGWRAEFALTNCDDPASLPGKLLRPTRCETLTLQDQSTGRYSYLTFKDAMLTAAIIIDSVPVAAARSWLAGFLTVPQKSNERHRLLAGLKPPDTQDHGMLVCSCMMVGESAIQEAVLNGCCTVNSVGDVTAAGTNCGSCRGDIAALIKQRQNVGQAV